MLVDKSPKQLVHQDNCCKSNQFNVGIYTQAITTWAEHWNNNPTPFIWKATAEDIQQMRDAVRQGLQAGAFGFTTSRTNSHKTPAGEMVPGRYSEVEELLGIALGEQAGSERRIHAQRYATRR